MDAASTDEPYTRTYLGDRVYLTTQPGKPAILEVDDWLTTNKSNQIYLVPEVASRLCKHLTLWLKDDCL